VARPLADHGILTVVGSYRLSPARYPDQVHDMRAVVGWVHENIAEYGGDPNRIYIGGHSAGAILSAFLSVQNTWLNEMSLPSDLIKGFVPVSGPYDLREFGGFVDNYLAEPEKGAEASPLLNMETVAPPAVIAYGSKEEVYAEPSRNFVDTYREKGGHAELLVLENMNHDDTALAAGDETSALVQAVLALIQK
jgi:acetyl esterase/lipase